MILCPFYRVDITETACAALQIIIKHPVDLVIMDIALPDYSGMELLRRMRVSGQDVNVIVMAGRGSVESAEEALRLGPWPTSSSHLISKRRLLWFSLHCRLCVMNQCRGQQCACALSR